MTLEVPLASWSIRARRVLAEAFGPLGQPWATSRRYRLGFAVVGVAAPLLVLGPTGQMYLTEPVFQTPDATAAVRTVWLPAAVAVTLIAWLGAALPAGEDGSRRHTLQRALMFAMVVPAIATNTVSAWMYGTLSSPAPSLFIALMVCWRVFLDYATGLFWAVGTTFVLLGMYYAESTGLIPLHPLSPDIVDPIYTEPALTPVMAQGVPAAVLILFGAVNYGVNQAVKLHRYITETVLRRYLPEDLVRLAARGDLELDGPPERREVTILFTDLVGFTALSEELGAEAVGAVLNRYLRVVSEVANDHGATLDKFIGDAVMLVFGAPQELPPEVQARKAVSLALAIRDAVKALEEDRPLEARTGINTGEVVVGNFGSRWRSDYTVIGPAVNVAARLESASEPGRILVGERTARLLALRSRPVELQLKGVRGTVQAWFVDAPPASVEPFADQRKEKLA